MARQRCRCHYTRQVRRAVQPQRDCRSPRAIVALRAPRLMMIKGHSAMARSYYVRPLRVKWRARISYPSRRSKRWAGSKTSSRGAQRGGICSLALAEAYLESRALHARSCSSRPMDNASFSERSRSARTGARDIPRFARDDIVVALCSRCVGAVSGLVRVQTVDACLATERSPPHPEIPRRTWK